MNLAAVQGAEELALDFRRRFADLIEEERTSVSGDFTVTGDLGPLEANEVRVLTVHYSGSVGVPVIENGGATIRVDEQTVSVALAAVVGDDALPDASWSADA